MAARRTYLQISEIDQLLAAWPGSAVAPVQLSPGPLELRLDGAIDTDFSAMHLSVRPRISDRVCIDEGRTGFVLAERPIIACGVEVSPPALLVSLPGREYRSLLEPGFRSIEFFCANEALVHEPFSALLEDLRAEPGQPVIPLDPGAAGQLRAAARMYISCAECDALETGDSSPLRLARQRVIRVLTAVVANYLRVTTPPSPARGTLALAALAEIDRRGARELTVRDLHGELGVSRRALEKSFESLMGVSPGQYLMAYRLNHLRQDLLGASKRVTDCLIDAGLTDASRAARQYRRLFGELPSSTLKRALTQTARSKPRAATMLSAMRS